MFKHFDNVDLAVQNKLYALVQLAKKDLISEFKESFGDDRNIEEISGLPYSGFIPFQNGGFSICEYYRNDCDASYHFLAEQTINNYALESNMIDDFIRENELNIQADNFDYNELSEDLQSDFEQLENEYFEPALLNFECWINNAKFNFCGNKQGVTIRLSINFKDAPYYRGKYATDLIDLNMSIKKFMHTSNSVIIAKCVNYKQVQRKAA
jgi:hypothetical protein